MCALCLQMQRIMFIPRQRYKGGCHQISFNLTRPQCNTYGLELNKCSLKLVKKSSCHHSQIWLRNVLSVTWECSLTEGYPWLNQVNSMCRSASSVTFNEHGIIFCLTLQQTCSIPSSWHARTIVIPTLQVVEIHDTSAPVCPKLHLSVNGQSTKILSYPAYIRCTLHWLPIEYRIKF